MHEADVVIVGAGAAGAMAALAAHEQGATFVGLDQLPAFGGTAIVSGGGMSVAGSHMQAERGISDSPGQALHDMLEDQSEADEQWARFYYQRGVEQLFGWLESQGVEFNNLTQNEGDSVPRRHVPKAVGLGLMTRLWERHKELGLDDRWHQGMTAVELALSERASEGPSRGTPRRGPEDSKNQGGRVVGVLAEDADGGRHAFRGKAVVFATGGFTGNHAMVVQHSPKLAAAGRVLAGGGVGAQGKGHQILLRHGARLVNAHNFVIYVYATPDYEDPTGERGLVCRGVEPCIWVNSAGERFHNELLNGGIYGAGALLQQQPPMCWAILDHDMAGRIDVADPRYRHGSDVLRDRVWQLLSDSPFIARGSTLRELAENAGVPPDTFERTVTEWNALLASGAERDPVTGRKLAGAMPFVAPPFYAMQFLPLARKNQGGIRTDLRCRVLNAADEPIPGLFAAGELCGFAGGHISGSRALEGIMLGGSLFSGRVAGAWAAQASGHGDGFVGTPNRE